MKALFGEELWKQLPEIIDFHMHPFSNREENIASYYGPMWEPNEVPADLARAGIHRFAGSVIQRLDGTTFDPIREMNDHALELRDRFGGAYYPGLSIHPNFVEESCRELDRIKANGLKLVGELVPYMMAWDQYASPAALEIFRYAEELDLVISCHPTYAEDMEKLAQACPHLTIVYAHPGNFGDWTAQLDRVKKYPNVYVDISGTGLFRYGMLRYAAGQVSTERMLFGTDYPICDPLMQVAGVLYENLPEADMERIFSGNAKRLLGLD